VADTASDLMVERLMDWGVDTIFGLPGDGINGFMEALRKRHGQIRYIHVRHEEVAAMAAVGYAKLTGKLGVCFATAGPGALHLANGLLDARLDGAPLLAITGMTYHDLIGTHYLQDFDTDHLFSNLAAYNQRIIGPAHIVNVVDVACRTALSHRLPSHIAFPIDYQVAEAGDDNRFKRNVKGHSTSSYARPGSGARGATACRRMPQRMREDRDPGRPGGARCRRRARAGGRQARRTGRQGFARQGLHPR
jgi:pyruvate dehydrogenase (quinone)